MESIRNGGHGDIIAGRYHVEGVLGQGGTATVYRVRDSKNGQLCALKRGSGSDARKAERHAALLEREYHTLAQLAHPRIIEVYEYGVDATGSYYTMELLEGGDLQASARLPWRQACALLYDVASSLAILHARSLIHRDVSLRNVRCTPEGRAKLIDFGAMMPMGVARNVLGTPPFIAPEVLQMQALDSRSDLFALGAVGYYLLTGRNAYPARRVHELRDMWRSRPVAPVKLVPDVPTALSELIIQLTAIDRAARPRSAAEVMERLCGIAELPVEEHAQVSRAYLTTPALVRRDKALVRVRRKLLSLIRREGGTVLIEGVDGIGRSRMLDACVLEGKVLGVNVLRADAGDAVGGDWSVARSLCNQLVAMLPREAAEATRLSRDVLAHVIDCLASEGVTAVQPDRSLLLRELRDFVLTLSRTQKLLIAVDDVEQLDEPSAAFLAALAHKSERHALMLVLAVNSDGHGSALAPLRLLRLVAESIELELLDPEETHSLIRSIFGDSPNGQYVAGRIHALAQGNPRSTMDLLRHLVDRGLARYQAGSWVLPSQFDEGELPNTLADALAERIAKLGPAARALVSMQALADGEPYTVHDYATLVGVREHKKVFAALDELLSARVLVAEGDSYRFAQRGFVPVARAALSEQQKQQMHGRHADRLRNISGDLALCSDHLLRAGRGREAIDLLCSVDLQTCLPSVSLLERAIEQTEALGYPKAKVHQLRAALLSKAAMMRDEAAFRRCLPLVLAQLERDSGLALYRELGELPEDSRLAQAIARTQERYAATPESERVYAVFDALRELARLCGALCSFANQIYDLDGLESLPSLQPLRALSPALAVVADIVESSKAFIAGRGQQNVELAEAVLQRISQADHGGLDAAQHRRTRLGLHYMLALLEASLGATKAGQRIAMLEEEREYRVIAWRLRMLMHRSQGNVEEARRCERRAELLQLQEQTDQVYMGSGLAAETSVAAETGDVVGLKTCLNGLALLAERHQGWRTMHAYGQCRFRMLQGDVQGALDVLLPAFQYTLPSRHNAFPWIAGMHVRLLADLGRTDEAITHGRKYLEIMHRERLDGSDRGIWLGLIQALTASGEFDAAIQTCRDVIEMALEQGAAGFSIGILYEARARVAAQMGDRASFNQYIDLCATEYKKAQNPALAARVTRLIEEAAQRDLGDETSAEVQGLLHAQNIEENEYNTIHSRMFECADGGERARCALTLLLQSTESAFGLLYGIRNGRPVLVAALPDAPVDADVNAWVDEGLKTAIGSDDVATVDDEDDVTRSAGILEYVDFDGRRLEAVFLITAAPTNQIAAVLVLDVTRGARSLPPRQLQQQLARELLDHGDVSLDQAPARAIDNEDN